ncbi:cadherin repeat domain-containing protein [Catenovulum sp. SX2]|uniref:cadherin repeat domain-containing protein n=1 Tax=Catenovulum sp. SX2 TaxID=3398614 RepID=UPI003F858FCC
MLNKSLLNIAIAAAALSLTACLDSGSSNEPEAKPITLGAVVQTVAADYSSSQVAQIDYDKDLDNYELTDGYMVKDKSDYTVASHLDSIFHIGRNSIDTVDFYNKDDLTTNLLGVSTNLAVEQSSSNPYTFVTLNKDKGYVIRYGADKILVVDPTSTSANDFVLSTIDLSAYTVEGSEQASPNAADAVIADGKLFVVMQRMHIEGWTWTPNTAYIAVIDTETDMEIETNADTTDAFKGIPLSGVNPLGGSLDVFGDYVYVAERSSYSSTDLSESKIEKVHVKNYQVSEVIAADKIVNNQAPIKQAVIVSATKGYFYVSAGWPEVSSIYEFNPKNGQIVNADVTSTALNGEGIGYMAVDSKNQLWISVSSSDNPGIDIVDTSDNSLVTNRLTTELNPARIAFIEELSAE